MWHCRTKNLIKLNCQLLDGSEGSKAKIEALKEMGFDGLLHVKIKAIRSEPVKWLCENLDCSNRTLPLLHGKKLELTDNDVKRVYKLPVGDPIKLQNVKGNAKLKAKIKSFEEDLGLNGRKMLYVKEQVVYNMLIDHGTADPIKFAKLYVLYALATLLVPTGGGNVDLRYAPFLDPISKTKNYNWAGHVLKETIHGVAAFQQKDRKNHPNARPSGDMHFLAVRI